MRIRHNIEALNSKNNLGKNNSATAKSLEKLSSGFRINRDGDDAAGLAISEKMRSQITGLSRASVNVQDGVSLVKTAEGALTEVHSMLNRMVELATQSANGIYSSDERQAMQEEVDSLKGEIDRICEGTRFNGKDVLTGSSRYMSSDKIPEQSADIGRGYPIVEEMTRVVECNKPIPPSVKNDKVAAMSIEFMFTPWEGSEVVLGDHEWDSYDGSKEPEISLILDFKIPKEKNKTSIITDEMVNEALKQCLSDPKKVSGYNDIDPKYYDFIDGINFKFRSDKGFVLHNRSVDYSHQTCLRNLGFDSHYEQVGTPLQLQIGDSNQNYDKLNLTINDMRCDAIGIDKVKVDPIEEALKALEKINTAINTVSEQRGELGAIQNRLEHTLNNLGVNVENMTAAESRIRDVDMAKEMMDYTKSNILNQSAQAMLAQSNQLPQSVLELLK